MNRTGTPGGILLVKTENEEREIEFELDFLRSLTRRQRFLMMNRKSREMKALLRCHGHGTAPSIIKRK